MTHDDAKQRVQDIRDSAGDDEVAHSLEDRLYHDFVKMVAAQEGPFRAIAEEILKTEVIDFERWCA